MGLFLQKGVDTVVLALDVIWYGIEKEMKHYTTKNLRKKEKSDAINADTSY